MRNYNHQIFKIFLIFSFVITLKLSAQQIKIYLKDAETGKNVSNAKVCLEGFEIPSIKMQYNKKGKYYYANEIPVNYNTVMVYHKKYNEKGFQDIKGLPKELNFQLHQPLQNYYDFIDKQGLNFNSSFPHNYYVEDPFKIVIRSSNQVSFTEFKKKLFTFLEKNNIEVEPIDPFLEFHQRENSNKVSDPESKYSDDKGVSPNIYGYDQEDDCRKNVMNTPKINTSVLFFRKMNKKRFKRFNDPIIQKLEENKEFITHTVLYNKFNMLDNLTSSKISNSNPYKERDLANNKFNSINKIDSSAIYFYNNSFPLFKFKNKNMYRGTQEANDGCIIHYTLLEKNNCNPIYIMDRFYSPPSCLLQNNETELNNLSLNFTLYKGLGLGILDLYENYHLTIKTKK